MTTYDVVKYIGYSDGKWVWKHFDEKGNVVYRSPEFNSEQEARDDYEKNWALIGTEGEDPRKDETPVTVIAPTPEEMEKIKQEDQVKAGSATPEGDMSAGTAAPEQENSNA